MQLKASDYEKILKFNGYINKNYDNFIQNVLFAVEQYIGFPLTTYNLFGVSSEGKAISDRIYSNVFPQQWLQRYQESIYQEDLFLTRISFLRASTEGKAFYTSDDVAEPDEFFSSGYGKALVENNTPYQITIIGAVESSLPLHVLCIFKTAQQGPFTSYERAILEKVAMVYKESVRLYKRFLSANMFGSFLDARTKSDGIGLEIIDEHKNVVYHNQEINQVLPICLNTSGTSETKRALLQTIVEHSGHSAGALREPLCMTIGEFDLSITPQRLSNEEGSHWYLFVETRRNTEEAAASSKVYSTPLSHAAEEFNLTLREQETLELLLQGKGNQQIAEELCVDISTVKFHVKNIFKKLEVTNRSALFAKFTSQ